MFIAHQGVAKVIQMGITDFPRRVTAFETKTGKETLLIQWNVIGQNACTVGFVLPNVAFYKIRAYNKRNVQCGEAEVSVIAAPSDIQHHPVRRRRRTINIR